MGAEVAIAAGVASATMSYMSSFDKYQAEQKQANEMVAAGDRMQTMLTENLRVGAAGYGQQQASLAEGSASQQAIIAAQTDKATGSLLAQGGASGAKLGTGTLSRQYQAQREQGLQGLANISGQYGRQAKGLAWKWQTGRDTMVANVDEQQKRLSVEEQALRSGSTKAWGYAPYQSILTGITTAATVGSMGAGGAGIDWGGWFGGPGKYTWGGYLKKPPVG